jgi:hypothetical protein
MHDPRAAATVSSRQPAAAPLSRSPSVEHALIIPQNRPRSNQVPSAGASVRWTAIGSRDRRGVLLHRGVIHYDYITAPHHAYLRGRYGAVVLINGVADAQITFTVA